MAGKKGSSPSVYKYYKIDGEKLSKHIKFVLVVVRAFSWQNTKTEERAVNVALQNFPNKVFFFLTLMPLIQNFQFLR